VAAGKFLADGVINFKKNMDRQKINFYENIFLG